MWELGYMVSIQGVIKYVVNIYGAMTLIISEVAAPFTIFIAMGEWSDFLAFWLEFGIFDYGVAASHVGLCVSLMIRVK